MAPVSQPRENYSQARKRAPRSPYAAKKKEKKRTSKKSSVPEAHKAKIPKIFRTGPHEIWKECIVKLHSDNMEKGTNTATYKAHVEETESAGGKERSSKDKRYRFWNLLTWVAEFEIF